MRMQGFGAALGALCLAACVHAQTPVSPSSLTFEPLPLSGFDDAIAHWQSKRGKDYPRHAPEDVRAIADNILALQRDHGGWVQNRDPLAVLSAEDLAKLAQERADPIASFDNRNIYTQVSYLMGAYARTGDARYKEGALRGLDFLLAQQMEGCGGWPHTVPAQNNYQHRLTLADEVMSGPLTMLRAAAQRDFPFTDLPEPSRVRAADALARGEACVLRLQVRQGERLTGWAGQYEPGSFTPAGGRSFELPAIVSQESVEMVRYLMSVPDPSPEIIAAVEGAVSWLEAVAIPDMAMEEVPLTQAQRFDYHDSDFDRVLVARPGKRLWARFHDLADNSIVLANRDGVRVARFEDIAIERRTGYSWYGTWPETLLTKEVPAWRCRVGLPPAPGAKACA